MDKASGSLRAALADCHRRIPDQEDAMGQPDTDRRIRMHVADLRRLPAPDGGDPLHIVVLAEDAGTGWLQIWVPQAEGVALAVALSRAELPRPGSYQMMAALLATNSVQVREVTIYDVVDGNFLARVDTAAGDVDARPSDALNLALVLDVPIYVSYEVMVAHARGGPNYSDIADPGGDGPDVIAAEALAVLAAMATRGAPPAV